MKTTTQRLAKISGAALLLTATLALPATAQRHRWDGWERGRGNGAFELDGTFVGMDQGCALIREHNGKVIPLLGNPGDLQRGDHLLFSGQLQGRSACGPAFRVGEVKRLAQACGRLAGPAAVRPIASDPAAALTEANAWAQTAKGAPAATGPAVRIEPMPGGRFAAYRFSAFPTFSTASPALRVTLPTVA